MADSPIDQSYLITLLKNEVRARLKTLLMQVAESSVDDVVNASIASLEVQIKQEFDEKYGRQMFDVLIRRNQS